MAIREPTDRFVSGGKLRDCDICGITWRKSELVKQKGYYVCPYDLDALREDERKQRIRR
jgi:hypothetical protein